MENQLENYVFEIGTAQETNLQAKKGCYERFLSEKYLKVGTFPTAK